MQDNCLLYIICNITALMCKITEKLTDLTCKITGLIDDKTALICKIFTFVSTYKSIIATYSYPSLSPTHQKAVNASLTFYQNIEYTKVENLNTNIVCVT